MAGVAAGRARRDLRVQPGQGEPRARARRLPRRVRGQAARRGGQPVRRIRVLQGAREEGVTGGQSM